MTTAILEVIMKNIQSAKHITIKYEILNLST